MGNSSDSRRRKLGIACLVVPGGMLILGETALKSSLDGFAFLVYWLLCFVLTFAAILLALMDMRAVRRRTRDEARALLEKTLRDMERKGSEGSPPDLDAP